MARNAAEKAVELGARVITLSDSKGFIYLKDGLKPEHLEPLHRLKENNRGALEELADEMGITKTTASNHLRKAEQQVMQFLIRYIDLAADD